MKKTIPLLLISPYCAIQISSTQSNKVVFTSFQYVESEYANKTVFKVWKNETLILPIRLVSGPVVPLIFSVKY